MSDLEIQKISEIKQKTLDRINWAKDDNSQNFKLIVSTLLEYAIGEAIEKYEVKGEIDNGEI